MYPLAVLLDILKLKHRQAAGIQILTKVAHYLAGMAILCVWVYFADVSIPFPILCDHTVCALSCGWLQSWAAAACRWCLAACLVISIKQFCQISRQADAPQASGMCRGMLSTHTWSVGNMWRTVSRDISPHPPPHHLCPPPRHTCWFSRVTVLLCWRLAGCPWSCHHPRQQASPGVGANYRW